MKAFKTWLISLIRSFLGIDSFTTNVESLLSIFKKDLSSVNMALLEHITNTELTLNVLTGPKGTINVLLWDLNNLKKHFNQYRDTEADQIQSFQKSMDTIRDALNTLEDLTLSLASNNKDAFEVVRYNSHKIELLKTQIRTWTQATDRVAQQAQITEFKLEHLDSICKILGYETSSRDGKPYTILKNIGLELRNGIVSEAPES